MPNYLPSSSVLDLYPARAKAKMQTSRIPRSALYNGRLDNLDIAKWFGCEIQKSLILKTQFKRYPFLLLLR